MKLNKDSLSTAIIFLVLLTIITVSLSYGVISQKTLIGPILLFLGLVSLFPLFFYKIPLQIVKADIIFGIIDNGLLALFALAGAELFGILGAVVGSLVGNAVTDGFAGIFEGYEWQKIIHRKTKENRTTLTVAVGKLCGCLFGAGTVLTIFWTLLKN